MRNSERLNKMIVESGFYIKDISKVSGYHPVYIRKRRFPQYDIEPDDFMIQVISESIEKLKLSKEPKVRWRKETLLKLKNLLNKGVERQKIADVFGINIHTLSRIIQLKLVASYEVREE